MRPMIRRPALGASPVEGRGRGLSVCEGGVSPLPTVLEAGPCDPRSCLRGSIETGEKLGRKPMRIATLSGDHLGRAFYDKVRPFVQKAVTGTDTRRSRQERAVGWPGQNAPVPIGGSRPRHSFLFSVWPPSACRSPACLNGWGRSRVARSGRGHGTPGAAPLRGSDPSHPSIGTLNRSWDSAPVTPSHGDRGWLEGLRRWAAPLAIPTHSRTRRKRPALAIPVGRGGRGRRSPRLLRCSRRSWGGRW